MPASVYRERRWNRDAREIVVRFGWAAGNGNTTELIHKNQFLKHGQPIHPIGGHNTHVHTAV
jgi:hypothetical protein